jgi:hypothetical protein
MKTLRAISLYADVLRPTWIFGAVIVLLPLTALFDIVGSPMVGNLFADYGFLESLIFAATLLSAAWALLLTAGLSLDGLRDRKEIGEPKRGQRWLTIPLRHVSPFVVFSLLALPGALAVVANSDQRLFAIAGLVAGGLVAYGLMDLSTSVIRLADHRLRVLPWMPFFGFVVLRSCPRKVVRVLAYVPSRLIRGLTWVAERLGMPDHLFDSRGLKGDNVLVVLSLLWTFLFWFVLYATLGPDGPLFAWLDVLPPAGFVYFLLVFFILLVSPLSVLLRRRRLVLPSLLIGVLLVSALPSRINLGASLPGSPTHTYDVYPTGKRSPLTTVDLLRMDGEGSDRAPQGTLIVAAASGGGILAAGWTAKVLTELHAAYPRFHDELRLVSAVSGGSVGTAYYLNALDHLDGKLARKDLLRVIDAATQTSLASAAYGFAFPDLRRFIFPFWAPELDRARLQEARWQRVALNGGGNGRRSQQLLADWNERIRRHEMPAFIFNATVMETGERIAITPLHSLRHLSLECGGGDFWSGWTPISGGDPLPVRRNSARTLSEFLGNSGDYTIDLWTAARLSATFSYVSPPASARLCDEATGRCGERAIDGVYAPLHLIDGGYHENYGVASALEWIARVARYCRDEGACPFDRIALVEIRAKPAGIRDRPTSEWIASWLGPPLGLMNSWEFAQTSANDTAVERLISEMHASDLGIELESFVFEPELGGKQAHTKDWCQKGGTCCCLRCCAEAMGCKSSAVADERSFSLSWHLSRAERQLIHEYWRDPQNQCSLRQFLRFVGWSPVEHERVLRERGGCGAPLENVTPATES